MKKHCCDEMTIRVNHRCVQHPDPFECPDNLIYYSLQFDEYGIIVHDGGSSYIEITYCPWCGRKLPESKRDKWFEELEKLGFEDPLFREDIPRPFQTDEWYKHKV